MFKIGDFSKLAMVSIRMLRYYDEKGLLKPVEIDKFTGYRYYDVKQLSEISYIKFLHKMGVSLSEIKNIKFAGYDKEKISEVLKNCYIQKKDELSQISLQLSTLKKTIDDLERNDTMTKYNVELKKMNRGKVAYIREVIPQYSEEGELWKKLYSSVGKNHIKLAMPCYPTSIYRDADYKESNPDIEIQISVDGEYKDTDALKFVKTEEMQVASVTFSGHYMQITDVYKALADWMEINKYTFAGNMFLIYIKSPSEVSNDSELVSELCIPVKKQ